jgi:hypothetical protein
LEPAHPIAVTFPASSEAIDALLGTKRGSPRVVPDETKLAITNCASRGSARSKTIGAVGHCSLLLVLSSLFVDHPFSPSHLIEPVRFSNACRLGRSRSAAQLNVGNRRASKGATERYEGLCRAHQPYSQNDGDTISWLVERLLEGFDMSRRPLLFCRGAIC